MSQRLKNFFSYHSNVNTPIRIVSFFYALSGIILVVVGLVALVGIVYVKIYFLSIIVIPFLVGGVLNIIISYGLSHLRKWVVYLLGIITVALVLMGNPYFVINLLVFIMVLAYRKRFEGSVNKKPFLIVIALIAIIVIGFFAWQYFSTDKSSNLLSDDRVVENEVSQSISIISPSRGERWYMGEENNIKINSPKEHYDKVVYILIAGGKDQGGLIIG
ncbi:MAG: hypothetical protein IID16_12100, partial [Candidatus Marinimicrobia bacterium]|nr:hypothetical protein [Candidatus Neomarinimicrobiota bacterium]